MQVNTAFTTCKYIYIQRERERKRESIQEKINFLCKSFRLCLYQLHIYNKMLLQLSNLQIPFLQTLIFHYYSNGNTNIEKLV